ncbi:helix-turn-helix domain-containing protein [Telluribacter sp. SYSU D00476]|uniref:helix-turn-helix domain-containing protein n=1 Tax=Telluribacter sp. SYSU D00476 TaxID=2811430 RepID=UPI001FF37408|nr:helix-turn-helix domain-containing protein [Telluribacter sp. SYSU D00476]
MQAERQDYTSERILGPPEFSEVFTHFYVAQNLTSQPVHKTLLPSFQTILLFSFGAQLSFTSPSGTTVEVEKCLLLWPVKQAIAYTLPPGADLLAANFKADAFYRFFGQAMVSDALPMHPDELLHENCFTNLWHLLKDIQTSAGRVGYLLDFCRPYLKYRDQTLASLAEFSSDSRLNPIRVVAQQTDQHERTIQLKHKKYLGYSAKEINRYQRFLRVVELLEAKVAGTEKVDWQDIVSQGGYYDQSQLIHDFRHYLGLSPTHFLRFQQDICIARPD